MKINNRQERYEFFKEHIGDYLGGYFLVKDKDEVEFIWVTRFLARNEGEDWFLEAPCRLIVHEDYIYESEEELKEAGLSVYKGQVYEIDSPQTTPFLPDEIEGIIPVDKSFVVKSMFEIREDDIALYNEIEEALKDDRFYSLEEVLKELDNEDLYDSLNFEKDED